MREFHRWTEKNGKQVPYRQLRSKLCRGWEKYKGKVLVRMPGASAQSEPVYYLADHKHWTGVKERVDAVCGRFPARFGEAGRRIAGAVVWGLLHPADLGNELAVEESAFSVYFKVRALWELSLAYNETHIEDTLKSFIDALSEAPVCSSLVAYDNDQPIAIPDEAVADVVTEPRPSPKRAAHVEALCSPSSSVSDLAMHATKLAKVDQEAPAPL